MTAACRTETSSPDAPSGGLRWNVAVSQFRPRTPRSGPSPGPVALRCPARRSHARAGPTGRFGPPVPPPGGGRRTGSGRRAGTRRTARRRPAVSRRCATPRGWPRPGGGRRRCSGRRRRAPDRVSVSGPSATCHTVCSRPSGAVKSSSGGVRQVAATTSVKAGPVRWSRATSAGRSRVVAKWRTSAATRSGRTDSWPRTRPSTKASVATSQTIPCATRCPVAAGRRTARPETRRTPRGRRRRTAGPGSRRR